jgi:hypothetical protein
MTGTPGKQKRWETSTAIDTDAALLILALSMIRRSPLASGLCQREARQRGPLCGERSRASECGLNPPRCGAARASKRRRVEVCP